MINLKTQKEIELLIEGGKILASVLDTVKKMIEPGIGTGELEAKATAMIRHAGGRPAFKDLELFNAKVFPSTLCTSINSEIVHGPALPSRKLKEGDIIGIDVGMEYPYRSKRSPKNRFSVGGGYYTDMAATVEVGRVDKKIHKLVETTRKSLVRGIKQVKPGHTLNDIGTAIQKYVEAAGFSVVRELVGHGVGHKYHEEPQIPHYNIEESGLSDVVLEPGMVLAIEPMVNMGSWGMKTADDDITFVTADGSISAHFEHTVAVTDKGYLIITA